MDMKHWGGIMLGAKQRRKSKLILLFGIREYGEKWCISINKEIRLVGNGTLTVREE